MDIINYYDILQLNNDASFEQIKTAYKEKMKVWHPDKNLDNVQQATEMTVLLNAAYEVLSDKKKRREYDLMLKYTKGKSFNDINNFNLSSALRKAGRLFNNIKDEVVVMHKMFRDCASGKYQINSLTLCTIGFALLYFIIPTDFVPDFIPLLGYTDDSAVIYMVSKSVAKELEKYKKHL